MVLDVRMNIVREFRSSNFFFTEVMLVLTLFRLIFMSSSPIISQARVEREEKAVREARPPQAKRPLNLEVPRRVFSFLSGVSIDS
jgi:hypothetical protein